MALFDINIDMVHISSDGFLYYLDNVHNDWN